MRTHRINILTSAAMVTGAIAALSNMIPNPEALNLSQQSSISISAVRNEAIAPQFIGQKQLTRNPKIQVKKDLVTTVLASVVDDIKHIDYYENSIDVQLCRKYAWQQISDRWMIVDQGFNLNKGKSQTKV